MTSYGLSHFKQMVRVWKTKSLLFCLRDDPLIVFRRQNHVTFIFIKTMSHDLSVQVAYFRLQPICQKDAPSIYLSWPKYWATSISREIQLDSTDSTVSCSWDLLRRRQNKACGTPLVKPKNNLPPGEERALKEPINNKEIILKKEDKGTTTVVMNRENKITEGQIQLDDRNNYQPLDKPMVGDTFQRVKHLINSLRQAGCIDEMTAKWFNQTPDPPRIPVFYTLTKIHKPTLVGRPIISGCN